MNIQLIGASDSLGGQSRGGGGGGAAGLGGGQRRSNGYVIPVTH